jgi:quercetin dioxygenase-like cupin family protein
VSVNTLVPPIDDSPLALATVELERGEEIGLSEAESDALLYVVAGEGSLTVGGESFSLDEGAAGLVLAGEEAAIAAGSLGLLLLQATAGPGTDRHAPLGARETIASSDDGDAERATGARSFRLLLGPHNGSTRATLFVGLVPPGRAPWHYHLYDEIVWVPEGPGRLHTGDAVTDLGPGSAFRLRPREVHIVENASSDRDLAVVGIFTPAGSPSAAYLTPDVAAEYRFAG